MQNTKSGPSTETGVQNGFTFVQPGAAATRVLPAGAQGLRHGSGPALNSRMVMEILKWEVSQPRSVINEEIRYLPASVKASLNGYIDMLEKLEYFRPVQAPSGDWIVSGGPTITSARNRSIDSFETLASTVLRCISQGRNLNEDNEVATVFLASYLTAFDAARRDYNAMILTGETNGVPSMRATKDIAKAAASIAVFTLLRLDTPEAELYGQRAAEMLEALKEGYIPMGYDNDGTLHVYCLYAKPRIAAGRTAAVAPRR